MNVHPLIVHFPIALLITGVLSDVFGFLRMRPFFQDVGLFLIGLGVLGAIAAGVSGDQAAEALSHISELTPFVEQHEDFATGTIWMFILLLLWRLYLKIRGRFTPLIRTAYVILSLTAGGLLSVTSYLGGVLVFEHGAGVKPAVERSSPGK